MKNLIRLCAVAFLIITFIGCGNIGGCGGPGGCGGAGMCFLPTSSNSKTSPS